jgi:hypothetical protein
MRLIRLAGTLSLSIAPFAFEAPGPAGERPDAGSRIPASTIAGARAGPVLQAPDLMAEGGRFELPWALRPGGFQVHCLAS